MRKRGRKSKGEREREIDRFISSINYHYEEHFNFIHIKGIKEKLEKFSNWGYAIGRPVLFRINELIEWAEETDKLLKEAKKWLRR